MASELTSPAVDITRLAALLKTKRGTRGLRSVAEEIKGVSASTLSRIEQGNVPDLETFMRLCQWLGVSADDFRSKRSAGSSAESAPTAEIIEAHLRADRTLPPDAINALSQMIRFAYKAAANGQIEPNKSPL